MSDHERHVLTVWVEDRSGELARIVGLFSGRGFNIDALTVNHTLEPGMSKVVLVTRGDEAVIEQIKKQLNKLVRVHKVKHLRNGQHLERELCIVTLHSPTAKSREELERIVRLTNARVIAFSPTAFTVEASGSSFEIESFLELVRPLGVRDMVRSAPIAMARPSAEAEAMAENSA
jgi:acetolactate synthase I/III small subunit